jgi:hypothetical protein
VISRHRKLVAGDNFGHPQKARDPDIPLHSTIFDHCIPNPTVNASTMPCQHNCDVKRLNFHLKDIKIDKIKTLREIYEVTDQLGRDYPHRREEVTRSKIEIDEKLLTAVAELLCIEDEISRGCTTCREN